MEKLRLLVTTKCPNKCPMCCNNSWDFSKLPVVEHFNYKEIMITGGEPLLFPEKLSNLAESIRTVQKLAYGNKGKLFLYTALADMLPNYIRPKELKHLWNAADGTEKDAWEHSTGS